MKAETPKPTYLKDYKVPTHLISDVELVFDIYDDRTTVTSKLSMQKNPASDEKGAPLVLNGESMKLEWVAIDGNRLSDGDYELTEKTLTLSPATETFTVEIQNTIDPANNTTLDGLYKSGDIFCSQCEPQGFRSITYFLDRSDVMSKYRTKIVADKSKYPVLLSNGNKIGTGDLEDGRHWVQWEDPFVKPCYLFALVAGDLGRIDDTFNTMTGRTIDLQIFCDKGNESRCQWAMESLKKSMKWDEDVFGLEYDLDLFMIVAVDAFNFGAMENKGLNIFNTSCVLADKSTETDANFMRVEGVVAHEYFHNWTGNRVTCRDWFQLTLKEGLTVFRDQEFSADMNSRPLHRIEDVLDLRNRQFVEDAGPTAHPIKPDRYIQINNFYTSTVYQKGATVIRMIQTLIGNEAFRKGIDKYFELYDGQAVTTEDFVHAMTVASGRDLTQFVRWYHQAGTPEVEVTWKYDAAAKTFALTTKQSCPETADGSPKEPFHFPFNVGLIGPDGKDMAVSLQQGTPHARVDGATAILEVTEPEQTFVFENVAEAPVASVNRNFCAPVKVKAPYTEEESLFLMARDSDSFNRWDSGHELATRLMLGMVDAFSEGEEFVLDPRYKDAYRVILEDSSLDRALKALALALPSEATLAQRQAIIDFDGNHLVREYCSSDLATTYRQLFLDEYDRHHDTGEYVLTPEAVGRRSLKNSCLAYLGRIGDEAVTELAYRQYKEAKNMTDQLAALSVLNNIECSEREEVLNAFYQQWKGDVLVMCKWLGVQALSKLDGTLERVTALKNSDIFDMGIPNLVRALFGSFAMNHVHFNSNDGVGYAFLADNIIELDAINPQIAARLAEGFRRYGKLDSLRKKAMGAELDRILSVGGLSNNTYEMVSKIAGAKKPAGSC